MRKACSVALVLSMAVLGAPMSAAAAGPLRPGQNPPSQTGNLQGVAKSAQQQNLPGVKVQVRAPNGSLAATGTTNGAGEFSFAGLNPATYTVEIMNAAGEIVGTASVTVTAGMTATVALTSTAIGAITAATTGGLSLLGLGTLGTVAVITGAATAGLIAINAVTKDASGSR
jgi:hypothetical protein